MTNIDEAGAKGKITVRVSTGYGAVPVKGAQIYITPLINEYNSDDYTYSLRTDNDGLTPLLELSAPPRSLSLSPGSTRLPYAEYVLTVIKEGYKTAELIGIPIFDGITSVQSVSLIPLTEDQIVLGDQKNQIFYENSGYDNLRVRLPSESEEQS